MTDLTESSTFEPGVFRLETSTPALGGVGGPLNAQAQSLANRTRYLKDQTDGLGLGKLDIRALPIGTSLEFSGTSLPPGFLWEDGANVSRTTYAALFSAIGTTYGAGNGSTTFAVPDSRGRVAVGRDNMGGTSAGRVTGVLGSHTLGAAGGDQWLHAHGHGLNDPGHAHSVGDPGHGHSIADPGHAHAVADPGHAHGMFDQAGTYGPNGNGARYAAVTINSNIGPKGTDAAGTGISIHAALTGIGIFGAGTGIWIGASGTGQTIQAAGAGGSQNIQPSIIKNKIIYTGTFI